jgi:hypothetical protein
MPTAVLLPTAVAAEDQWTLGAGSSKEAAVQTSDENTSFISESTVGDRQSFSTGDLPPAVQVFQVDVVMNAARGGGTDGAVNMYVGISGSIVDGANKTTGSSYADFSELNISRPGGGSWSPADFPPLGSTRVGVRNQSGNNSRVTYLALQVSYLEPTGGFNWLIGCWLPPLIAVASHGLTLTEAAKILQRLSVRPSSARDHRKLLEAFRVRPVYAWR